MELFILRTTVLLKLWMQIISVAILSPLDAHLLDQYELKSCSIKFGVKIWRFKMQAILQSELRNYLESLRVKIVN